MKQSKPVQKVLFGHHKCASSYVNDIFLDIRKRTASTLTFNPNKANGKCVEELVIFQNAQHEDLDLISSDFKGLHIIRDPRDIVVSAYFSHLKTHPLQSWLETHREELLKMDKDEGLFATIDFMAYQMCDFMEWDYSDDRIFEIKFEEMVASPSVLIDGLNFIGLIEEISSMQRYLKFLQRGLRNKGLNFGHVSMGIPKREVLEILSNHSFAKKAKGRKSGQVDTSSHYRKGEPGDWRNHFTKEHADYFNKKHGALLIKQGYEKDLNWV